MDKNWDTACFFTASLLAAPRLPTLPPSHEIFKELALVGLSRLATCETTSIYQSITNNHASFCLWWEETLLNNENVSKYVLIVAWHGQVFGDTHFVSPLELEVNDSPKRLCKKLIIQYTFSINLNVILCYLYSLSIYQYP